MSSTTWDTGAAPGASPNHYKERPRGPSIAPEDWNAPPLPKPSQRRRSSDASDLPSDTPLLPPRYVLILIRLLLLYKTSVTTFLSPRVEIATPVTSFKSLKEAIFLSLRDVNVYEGGVVHTMPILVWLMKWAGTVGEMLGGFIGGGWMLVGVLWVLAEWMCAEGAASIGEWRAEHVRNEVWEEESDIEEEEAIAPVVEDNAPANLEAKDANDPNVEPSAEGAASVDEATVGEQEPETLNTNETQEGQESADSEEEPRTEVEDSAAPLIPPWHLLPTPTIAPASPQLAVVKPSTIPPTRLLSADEIRTVYLLNPYSLLSTLGLSTIGFTNVSIIGALYFGTKGRIVPALLSLSCATYLSLYPFMLLAPLSMLLHQTTGRSLVSTVVTATCGLCVFTSALLGVSYHLTGSWDFLSATWGVILSASDLTPNTGIYWYFFIEIFDQFRTFFLVVFQLIVVVFAIPVTATFKDDPIFAALLLSMIMSIFKSYPSVGDVAVWMGLMAGCGELWPYMQNTYLTFTSLFFASILGPLFYYLWIYAGSGNANFFYAITLVWGIAQILIVLDLVGAKKRRKWEGVNKGLRSLECLYK
ncbi:hypothetical protein HDU85_001110 [Gaertneriomyces sp. JEL0708]|nr:hypothetical protein HDU85_001110 [Gaertneriomyces sp. JEL0708]